MTWQANLKKWTSAPRLIKSLLSNSMSNNNNCKPVLLNSSKGHELADIMRSWTNTLLQLRLKSIRLHVRSNRRYRAAKNYFTNSNQLHNDAVNHALSNILTYKPLRLTNAIFKASTTTSTAHTTTPSWTREGKNAHTLLIFASSLTLKSAKRKTPAALPTTG